MISSLYIPGDSPVHRLKPGIKIMSLAVFGTLIFAFSSIPLAFSAFASVLILHRISGIPLSIGISQLKPTIVILAVIFVVQALIDHWTTAVLVVVRLSALLLLASLVTLTTRTSDMIESLEHGLEWLRFLGVNPAKASLTISLALRFIPVLATIAGDVREAQRARGLDRSIIAVAIPVLVRTLKMADDIANAIEARSYDPQLNDKRTKAKNLGQQKTSGEAE
jgi:biotin transport system permease protein